MMSSVSFVAVSVNATIGVFEARDYSIAFHRNDET